MTKEELVEAVATAIELCEHPYSSEHIAIAAVKIVVEECAKVAEQILVYADTTSASDKEIAAAIRSLSPKED